MSKEDAPGGVLFNFRVLCCVLVLKVGTRTELVSRFMRMIAVCFYNATVFTHASLESKYHGTVLG